MLRTPTKPRTYSRAKQPPPVPTPAHAKTNAHAANEPSLDDDSGSERIPETQVTASPSGSVKSTSSRTSARVANQKATAADATLDPNPAALVTPSPKKRGRKSDAADNSPSKKHRTTKAKATANGNDDSDDTLSHLNSLISDNVEKYVKKALSKQDRRFNKLTESIQKKLNLQTDNVASSSSGSSSRSTSRSNSRAPSVGEPTKQFPTVSSMYNPYIVQSIAPPVQNAVPPPHGPHFPTTPFGNYYPGTPPTPASLVQHYPWAEDHLSSISNGTFDVNNLPKLLRDDDVRKAYIADSIDGVLTDLRSGKQKVVMAGSKLQTALPDLPTFLSAFYVYAAIRTSYQPEYGPPFMAWMEQITYHASKAPDWTRVFRYAVQYFRTYQKAPPEKWLTFDGQLIAIHFTHAPAPAHNQSNNPPTGNRHQREFRTSNRTQSNNAQTPLHLQTCMNWNRPKGCDFEAKNGKPCGRLHICYSCGQRGHISPKCPTKPMSSPTDRN